MSITETGANTMPFSEDLKDFDEFKRQMNVRANQATTFDAFAEAVEELDEHDELMLPAVREYLDLFSR